MDINIQRMDRNLVVRLNGELDHHFAAGIREEIDGEILGSDLDKLILDFSGVSFMDSSGIGVIMGRYKKMTERGGCVVATGVNPSIDKLIEVSGLRKIIPEFVSLDEALCYEREGELA